ncbi:MAG TPA: hypothetical protein VHH35_20965 [Pyrinomonadaceae bacterium]|nr:hypothetical protein [Pyrinomonadaceae bacterium]
MKNKTLGICLLILVALVSSALWVNSASRADSAPSDPTVQAGDTTLAAALSLEDMVDQSEVIAIGSVVDTKSVWVDRSLVTLANVAVSETLKGDESTTTLTVALPGGVDINRKVPVAMSYAGAPKMTPGEDVFVFLTNSSEVAGSYTVAGFSQGKFSIVKDEDGEPMVSRDLRQTSLQDKNGVRRGQNNLTPLSSLKSEVKRRLHKQ